MKSDRNYKKCGVLSKKGWGCEYWLENKEGGYCVKVLSFIKGKKCSMHFHGIKEETFLVTRGLFELIRINTHNGREYSVVLKKGDYVSIPRLEPHQIICVVTGTIIEASTFHREDDSYRVKPGDSQKKQV